MKEFQDDYGVLADPRYFVLDEKEYQKIESEGGEGGATVDPTPKEVTCTENGEYTVEPGEGFDGLSSVNVTVEVPAPSGGNALILKKNNVSVPLGSRDYDYDTGSYIENLNGNPFTVISSDAASKVYMFRIYEKNEMGMPEEIKNLKDYNLPVTTRNMYESDPGGGRTISPDSYIIIFGTDTPGATLIVDTTYFDIVELPSGYSSDFSVHEVTPEQ